MDKKNLNRLVSEQEWQEGAGGLLLLAAVHETERLLEPWDDYLVRYVQEPVIVEFLEMVMAVRLRPGPNAVRWRRRRRRRWRCSNVEIRVPHVVRQKVEAEETGLKRLEHAEVTI